MCEVADAYQLPTMGPRRHCFLLEGNGTMLNVRKQTPFDDGDQQRSTHILSGLNASPHVSYKRQYICGQAWAWSAQELT